MFHGDVPGPGRSTTPPRHPRPGHPPDGPESGPQSRPGVRVHPLVGLPATANRAPQPTLPSGSPVPSVVPIAANPGCHHHPVRLPSWCSHNRALWHVRHGERPPPWPPTGGPPPTGLLPGCLSFWPRRGCLPRPIRRRLPRPRPGGWSPPANSGCPAQSPVSQRSDVLVRPYPDGASTSAELA